MSITNDLRDKPIPLRKENAASAHDYHDVPIALETSLASDSLVRVSDYGLAQNSYYAATDRLNAPYYKCFENASPDVYLRKTVVEKLVAVNQLLEPYNVELYLLDGYRPIALQCEVWTDFVNQARTVLDNPSEEECARYAGYYCSDPRNFDEDDYRTWPTHSTGGAIDLCLRSVKTGDQLFFGSVFDDATEITYTDHFEKTSGKTDGASLVEARRNRRLLYWAMVNNDFANYPYEWWHFDWGTQMWVTNSDEAGRQAVFGHAKKPI